MTSQPNKDNPSVPSGDAMTPEQIRQSTQENQDQNRPDQNQAGQQNQKRVANDGSTPGYGLTSSEENEAPERAYENGKDRIDDLGDTK